MLGQHSVMTHSRGTPVASIRARMLRAAISPGRALSRLYVKSGIPALLARAAFIRHPRRRELARQIDRHLQHLALDNAIVHAHRTIPQIIRGGAARNAAVLAVGCCNMIEIYAFKSYGYEEVTGIDVVSQNPAHIKLMDMHNMSFKNAKFDVVYCSGALQCSYDPGKVVAELVRVLKPGGLLAVVVPVGFTTDDVYPLDVGSLEGLLQLFRRWSPTLIWAESVQGATSENPHRFPVVRAVMKFSETNAVN